MSSVPDPLDLLTISPAAFATPIDSEIMVMDIEKGRYLVLNDIGGEIWSHLASSEHGISVSELTQRLEEKYDSPAGVVATDVANFLQQLDERHLLSRSRA